MKLNEYKKMLKENNIFLFDHDIRISHYIINKFHNNNNQIGGGKNIFNNKEPYEIKKIVDTSLSKNFYNLIFLD
jgi:hypothetical protein